MPTFNAKVSTEVEVEFEVFCGRCGAGLCSQSTGRNSSRRNTPQVEVMPCERCTEDMIAEAISKVEGGN